MSLEPRSFTVTDQWAADAATSIPLTPVSGQQYRNPAVSAATIRAGQTYDVVADSAIWNQILFQMSGLAKESEVYGWPRWSPLTDYVGGYASKCTGDDGIPYLAKKKSGPGMSDGSKRPKTEPDYWISLPDWIAECIGVGGIPMWDKEECYNPLPWIVWGSDLMLYVAENPSGPCVSGVGPKDPTKTTGYWITLPDWIKSKVQINIPESNNDLIYPGAFHKFYERTPPAGWMVRNGALISNASFNVPLLWESLQLAKNSWKVISESSWQSMSKATPWNGIGGVPFFVLDTSANTIRLPDTRGMYEEDAGFDGLIVGGVHGDAIRNITARTSYVQYTHPPSVGSGAFTLGWTGVAGKYNAIFDGTGQGAFELILDTSAVVPTAIVNRPKAFGMLGCVYVGLSAEQGGGK